MKGIFTLLLVLAATSLFADDYRTAAAGNWNNPAIWERFDGSNWVAASASPTSADGIITLLHNVTVTAPVTVDQVVGTAGTLTVNSTLTLNDGTGTDLALSGNLNLRNTLNGSGAATVSGTTTFENFPALSGITLTLNGNSTFETFMQFSNNAHLVVGAGTTMTLIELSNASFDGTGSLTNNGTITFAPNVGGMDCRVPLTNNGTLSIINSGPGKAWLQRKPSTHTGGAITIAANSTFHTDYDFNQSHSFTNVAITGGGIFRTGFGSGVPGVCHLNAGTTLTCHAEFGSGADINLNTSIAPLSLAMGTSIIGTGNVTLANNFTWSSGHFKNSGTVTVNGEATLVNGIGSRENGPLIFNGNVSHFIEASITGNGTGSVVIGPSSTYTTGNSGNPPGISGQASVTNNGTLVKVGSANFEMASNFINNGTLRIEQGTFRQLSSTSFTNAATGVVKGTATLNLNSAGSVTNNGSIQPGLSPGTITINRTTGVPVHHVGIEVQSNTGPGTGHDLLTSSNAVNLTGGHLTITRLGNFIPANGATFTILTASSVTGTFSNVAPPCWSATYNPTSVVITYTASPLVYADTDTDGYGDPNVSAPDCDAPSGYVPNNTDCDDTNPNTYPGATELCDGLDNDCNGQIDGGTDKAALLAFYNATNGANWTNNFGWVDGAAGTDCNVCGWDGVTCDGNGRVEGLWLNGNNLVGTLPSQLGNLSQLVSLDLSDNQLSGTITSALGNLSNLQQLALRNNQLSGSVPNELGGLSNLTGLELSSNQLTGNIPVTLGTLSNLQVLTLEFNQLSGSIPSELGNLSNLSFLLLNDNSLNGSIPSTLGNLSNLFFLSLGNNPLSGSLPSTLGNLSNLYELYIENTQLSGSIPSTLGNLSNLYFLALNNNSLSGSIPSALGNMSGLYYLYLHDNSLSGSIPGALGNLSNLQALLFQNNNLSGCFDPNLNNLCGIAYDFSNNPGLHLGGDFAAFCDDGAGGCGIDADGDGFAFPDDCNDRDNTIHPNATEVCDGVDNDCDGTTDEGCDTDNDGFTTAQGDCNDNNASIHPNATEICDGLDNDCDNLIDGADPNVMDNQPPSISCPPNATVAANASCTGTIGSHSAAAANDDCGTPSVAQSPAASTTLSGHNTAQTVTLTATDAGNNTATCAFTVTLKDVTPPNISCPPNATVAANASCTGTIGSHSAASTSDNCGSPSVAQSPAASTPLSGHNAAQTVTLTATDVGNNTATCAFTVTLKDVTPPSISCPPNATVAANASCSGTVGSHSAASTSDNCGSPTVAQSPASGTPLSGHNDVETVTLTATDAGNNTATCAFTVTLKDVTPPSISCPANATVAANGSCSGTIGSHSAATTSDNCGTSNVTQSPAASTTLTGHNTAQTVTLTADDTHGNTATCAFSVTLKDVTPPNISCPADIVSETATVTYTPPVGTDNCPGASTAQTDGTGYTSGSTFPPGITTLQYTVTDGAGLTGICTFNVILGIPPEITCPTNIVTTVAPNTCFKVVTYTPPVGTDDEPGATTTQTDGTGLTTGSSFPAGTTTLQYTVTDADNLTATCTFTVKVTEGVLPTIVCPGNITKNTDYNQCSAVTTYSTPTFSDNCAGASIMRTNGFASGSAFPKGTTMVNWKVTDASGNSSVCGFTVTVNDTQAPGISCPHVTKGTDPGLCTAVVNYAAPTILDNCPGGSTAWVSGPQQGATLPKGQHTVTWKATDAVGLTKTCTFRITVNDVQAPSITCPGSQTKNTDPNLCSAVTTYTTPTYWDNCAGGSVVRLSGLSSGSAFPRGTTVVVWKATDAVGLTKTCSFTVTVNDNQLPTLNCPSNIVVTAPPGQCNATVTYTNPTASDNCTVQSVFLLSGLASGSVFPQGTTTNVWRAVDNSGVSNTCVFTVTVGCGASPNPSEGGESKASRSAVPSPPLRGGREGLLLSLSPNPAATQVQIWMEKVGETGGLLTVLDALGRMVARVPVAAGQQQLTLDVSGSDFPAGMYQVVLQTPQERTSKVLIISKL